MRRTRTSARRRGRRPPAACASPLGNLPPRNRGKRPGSPRRPSWIPLALSGSRGHRRRRDVGDERPHALRGWPTGARVRAERRHEHEEQPEQHSPQGNAIGAWPSPLMGTTRGSAAVELDEPRGWSDLAADRDRATGPWPRPVRRSRTVRRAQGRVSRATSRAGRCLWHVGCPLSSAYGGRAHY